MIQIIFFYLPWSIRTIAILLIQIVVSFPCSASEIIVKTTRQTPVSGFQNRFHRLQSDENWNTKEVAVIICDVWDSHHCVNAVRRVQELAPRIEALAAKLREEGATIIHSPSDCMKFYELHEARSRAKAVPVAANLPSDLNKWCDSIASEANTLYPVNQADGGEDDDPVEHAQWAQTLKDQERDPRRPWRQQIETIKIDPYRDFITDSGNEVWNILESQGIRHVVICGVHTNMCVLGRPFGLRQLASHGKQAVLLRDLTDSMYNPSSWPFVSHFSGTDLIIDHIERYVSPTTTSDQFFGGTSAAIDPELLLPFTFSHDHRPHLAIIIAEDEYQTAKTVPTFAMVHLQEKVRLSFVYGDTGDPSELPGLEAIDDADALLISVRRRPLRPEDLRRVRRFIESGKPIIGIRTASHAFSLRDGSKIQGLEQWPEFDSYAFGGNYTSHHANEFAPFIERISPSEELFISKGSLYQVRPLREGARVYWTGRIEGKEEEPVAWTYIRPDGGFSFYTSLGCPTDFEVPPFQELLSNAVFSALQLPHTNEVAIVSRSKSYSSGTGRQR